MENKITSRMGFSFPFHILLGSISMSVAGIVAVFENPLLGIGLIVVGSFFWSSSYGSQIDFDKGVFREFGTIFGIKRGEWKKLEKLKDVTILVGQQKTAIMANVVQVGTSTDDRYEVCLLNESHRVRIVIQKYKDLEEAKTFAASLATKMNGSVVKYSPAISQKTRNRR